MAMKWLPALSAPTACFVRSKKYCLKMLGSSVLPDLLETMKSVRAISTLFSKAFTCAGSVESRTCRSGYPAILPKVMRRTSGHKLDPPMPSRRMSLKPALQTSLARFPQLDGVRDLFFGNVQPSQPFGLIVPVHSVASRCQRRCILLPDCQSSTAVFTAVARVSGSEVFSGSSVLSFWTECFSRPQPATCGTHRRKASRRRRSAWWSLL
jgi:hypothetical protein